jgi:hypothetical protein
MIIFEGLGLSAKKLFNTYKVGDIEVTISKKWEKQIVEESNKTNFDLTTCEFCDQYNSLWDIFCPAESPSFHEELKQEIENKIRKKYLITNSSPLPNVKNGIEKESFTLVRDKKGRIIRRYWIKHFFGKDLVAKEHVEAKWLRRLYDVKSKEAEDALKLRKLGVQTPDFVARLKVPKRGILISAYERVQGFIPATILIQSLSETEKEELLNDVKKLGVNLIDGNALPSIFRSHEILVSKNSPREFVLTDTAIGMAPISRNKILLLEELEFDKNLPKPNWDDIHEDTRKFLRYWNSLPMNTRRKIQLNYLQNVLDEIKLGEQEDIEEIRVRINNLVVKLFPSSKTAKEIKLKSSNQN